MDFKHVPGSHTGRNLGDHVYEVLKEYGIRRKLFCITTDNATNNATMMKQISSLLRNDLNVQWDPEKHHITCINHIINLAVQDFLKSLKVLGPASEPTLEGEEDDSSDLDGNDSVDENDEMSDEEDICGGSFEGVLKKIRALAKVCLVCDI